MTPNPLNTYIETVRSESPSTPAMMDESSIFVLLSDITSQHLLSYEELIEASISSVFVYDIPEDKKEFNIETVRQCIIDIELMPYSGKHTYILRHFDTATLPAQNALLKILEECPPYAVILLEVDNPNSVLETIRSRVIDLTLMQQRGILSSQ
jgi:DNA polymerase-3 subunit delta'